MKRKLVALGCLVVLAAGTVIMLQPSAGAGQTLKYRLSFRTGEFDNIDADDNGFGDAGDYEVGEFGLKKNGEVEGHLNFNCLQTSDQPPRDLCWAAARIEGKGTLIIADVEKSGDSPSTVVAITGGTGAFRGASGVARLDFRDGFVTFEID